MMGLQDGHTESTLYSVHSCFSHRAEPGEYLCASTSGICCVYGMTTIGALDAAKPVLCAVVVLCAAGQRVADFFEDVRHTVQVPGGGGEIANEQ